MARRVIQRMWRILATAGAAAASVAGLAWAALQAGWRIVPTIPKRAYALVILAVLIASGYLAGAYLVRTVFYPTQVPAWFVTVPERLTAESLRRDDAAGPAGRPMRAPLGHYHGVDRWYHADPRDTCTAAGCHNPLPHTKIVPMRAFTNLHATFIACQTCHTAAGERPVRLVWVQVASGKPDKPPAILRLAQLLAGRRDQIRDEPQQAHGEIIDLLRQTIALVGEDPVLEYMLLQIDTSEPGSPVWRHAVDQLTSELPQHARGDYAAKLAPDIINGPPAGSEEPARMTREFLAAAPDSSERKRLQLKIHASLTAKPGGCLACHGDSPGLIDFESVGYSKQRAAALSHLSVADEIQRIRRGEEFHLPGLLEGR